MTTAIDLFAGLGGWSTGARMAGVEVLWAANHWPDAVQWHSANHPGAIHVCQDLHQANWSQVPAHDLPRALEQVAEFILEQDGERLVWGNGATFDNVILRRAFDDCAIEAPWHFWHDRDLRTILGLYPEAKAREFEGVKHHALHDARHEAHMLIDALRLHAQRNGEAGPTLFGLQVVIDPAMPPDAIRLVQG